MVNNMIMISIADIPRDKQHEHAHSLLRECLKPLGITYSSDTAISKNRYGKPSLAEYPEVKYNISHADGICACIVSEYECGIDCEPVRQYRPNVLKRAFSESERDMIEKADTDERDLLFFRLWTLKEAYIKAIGTGLSYPMKNADFDFSGSEIITEISDYDFRQYILKGGKYVVSIALGTAQK